jgi:uncharacterized protein
LITNDILLEYEEIISQKANQFVAKNTLELLNVASNAIKTETYFQWKLIEQDPDDNKFVDCALAGNAHFIVTHDVHFETLKQLNFPKLEVISGMEFIKILES